MKKGLFIQLGIVLSIVLLVLFSAIIYYKSNGNSFESNKDIEETKNIVVSNSSYHRAVPTNFTKSSNLNDLIFYERSLNQEINKISPLINNKVLKSVNVKSFKKISNNKKYLISLSSGAYSAKDYGLLYFKAKLNRENASKSLKVKFYNSSSGNAALVAYINVNSNTSDYYIPFNINKDGLGNDISLIKKYEVDRISFVSEKGDEINSVSISDIAVYKVTNGSKVGNKYVDIDYLPSYNYYLINSKQQATMKSELSSNASWRTAALANIEKIRKGNFKVVVKDANGKVLPNANVKINMYEHEFNFGTAINGGTGSGGYAQLAASLFNTAVNENSFKWRIFQDNPNASRNEFATIKSLGVKHFRGHTLTWGAHYPTNLKYDLNNPNSIKTKAQMKAANQMIIDHIKNQVSYYSDYEEIDVINEEASSSSHAELRKRYEKLTGSSQYRLLNSWFKAAKEANPNAKLYYNETKVFNKNSKNEISTNAEFHKILNYLVKNGKYIDGVGVQSHHDVGKTYSSASLIKHTNLYNKIYNSYKLPVKITEYSCSWQDSYFQANYTRDFLINIFSNQAVNGFLTWSFTDNSSYALYALIYDKNGDLKPSGKEYIDLVYNKWWTRNATAKTNSSGEAIINGYYGDYDIEVTYNGKTYRAQAPFYSGQQNIKEIKLTNVTSSSKDTTTNNTKPSTQKNPTTSSTSTQKNPSTSSTSTSKYNLSNASVYVQSQTYTGSQIKPNPVVSVKQSNGTYKKLVKDVDYTVSYGKNTDIGQNGTVTVTAKSSSYTGSKTVKFWINPKSITIATNTKNLSAKVGSSATFSLHATGTSPKYQWYKILSADAPKYVYGFNVARHDEGGTSFYRYKFENVKPKSDTYYHIRFNPYNFEVGHTYKIHVSVRRIGMQNLDYVVLRHSAFTHDYGSSGLQSVNITNSLKYNEWKELTLIRKFTTNQLTLEGQTKNVEPLIEFAVKLAKNKSNKLVIDIKDVWVEDLNTGLIVSRPTVDKAYFKRTPISGANGPTYTINSVSMKNNNSYYYCVVTNSYGSKSSKVASLKVNK